MSTRALAALPFALVAALSVACGGGAGSDSAEDQSGAASTAGAPALGLYVLQLADNQVEPRSAFWVNFLNFHHDGTYDGSFGNGLSNNSGHLPVLANGKYAFSHDSQGTYVSFDGGAPQYYKVDADGSLEVEETEGNSTPVWLKMVKAPSPTTLNFAADGTQSASTTLTEGSNILVRYDAHRQTCGDTVTAFYSVDGSPAQSMSFPKAVNGFYDMLLSVSTGTDLAFWFEDTGNGCQAWDSSGGKNFHFAVQASDNGE